ncbi:MAG TPA: DUF6717 family protein [Tepidisphaeraceae bacterium]
MRSAFAIVVAFVFAGTGGCASPPTRIELSGTAGARATGYYIQDGRRVEINAALPTTLPAHGISQFAVRKSNAQADLIVSVQGPNGSMRHELRPGKGTGVRVQVAGGINVALLSDDESLDRSTNAIRVISPYWYNGTWVFDDSRTGLQREPFVAGAPEVIDYLARTIPEARAGIRLTFSAEPFPGYQETLIWVRAESGGNLYKLASRPMEGWLCPAMFRYFDKTPKELFVRVDPKGT